MQIDKLFLLRHLLENKSSIRNTRIYCPLEKFQTRSIHFYDDGGDDF